MADRSQTKIGDASARAASNPGDGVPADHSVGRWPVMRQKWRDILFLHWAFSPQEIRSLVPPQLELDLFEGNAYVGLVPFTMTGVRPVGLPPLWGLSSFHETNLRTYVRFDGHDPGVWFFNLEAANSLAVRIARALFHLPYHRARMLLAREQPENESSSSRSAIVYAGADCGPGRYQPHT